MTKPAAALRFTATAARAFSFTAQGLPAKAGAPLIPTLARTGFIRTLGGIDIYLAARARVAGLRRTDLDAAAAGGELQIVPAVRGCIYAVPKSEAPLCLRVAEVQSRARAEREHEKAGVRPGEVEALAEAVLETLKAKGPMTTDALRRALPDGTVRSLGEAGKKVGISSPLPPALRRLEFSGEIERTQQGGRLDTERYLWRVPSKNVFAGAKLPDDPSELYARLAVHFLRGAGLGTVKDFAAWAGLAQREAKAAVERTPAVPAEAEGIAGPLFALEESFDLLKGNVPLDGASFLPFEDNLVAFHGGAAALIDPAVAQVSVPVWGSSKVAPLGEARSMSLRSIAADGKIVGFWEYDPAAREVVWICFDQVSPATKERIAAEAEDTARFIRDEIGHGKSFSIDSDADLVKRAGMVRKLGAGS